MVVSFSREAAAFTYFFFSLFSAISECIGTANWLVFKRGANFLKETSLTDNISCVVKCVYYELSNEYPNSARFLGKGHQIVKQHLKNPSRYSICHR